MTSFYYASSPTHGNWFQTNQPEQELDDCAGDTVTSVCVGGGGCVCVCVCVCVTNGKGMALQRQI